MSSSDHYNLETSDTFFRNLLEMAPDAMIIADDTGLIVVVNSQVEGMFGYLREQLYGKPIEMLLPEEVRKRHVHHRSGYAVDPHVRPMGRDMELAGRRRDGSEFPVEISLSPVRTNEGFFVSSVIRDVTDRKILEDALIEARRSAERANKANTAFLAAASHDLRQPVQALTLLNGALRRTVSDQGALDMIESQQQSLDGMTNLLNSLLDISRLDAGAVEPQVEVFPLQRLLDRLSTEFSRQASQKGLEFSAAPSSIVVNTDPNLLGEVIQNFVSNAIRYTPAGRVELACERINGHVCIRVTDTGIGIEPDNLGEIFAEFHQLNTAGQKKQGFGLGLAIVQRLSDLLGHRIEVESVPGKGSEFSICLPFFGDAADDVIASVQPRAAEGKKSGTVILIEDDTAVANALSSLMEATGYRVAVAASAKEADAIARHLDDPPDLIVSDFHLIDGSTGVEAVKVMREVYERNIPALIVTGDTSIVMDAAKDLPNSLLTRKPVNPDILLRDAAIAIETGFVPDSS